MGRSREKQIGIAMKRTNGRWQYESQKHYAVVRYGAEENPRHHEGIELPERIASGDIPGDIPPYRRGRGHNLYRKAFARLHIRAGGVNLVEENKIISYGFLAAGLVFVLAVCWWLLSEPDVRDQRERAADVGAALERVGGEQQRAAESAQRLDAGLERSITIIERVEERTGNASDAVDRAASGNEKLVRIVEDSQRRVEASQQILQGIRARARQN